MSADMNIPFRIKAVAAAVLFLTLFSGRQTEAYAQTPSEEKAKPVYLHYIVEGGDTLFVENIQPAWIWGKGKRTSRDWRKYYRLVNNFSKAYPYALVAKKLVAETDSTFVADKMRRRKKEKYVNSLQKELFGAFEEPLKHLTISQGQLIMKLIDREIGVSSYKIIKTYKSGMAAGFWQGVAKMFGTDMKRPYDPKGEDKDVEELVQIWNRGEFPAYYYSLFGKYPNIPEIPSKYR